MNEYNKLYEYENLFESNNYLLPVGAVIQVSELSIKKGSEIIEHKQICDEVTYAISGKAIINSDDDSREMQSGDIHFIKKGVKHSIVADENENFRYICIGINLDKNCKEISDFNIIKIDKFFYVRDDGSIKSLAELLVNEFYIRDNNSDMMINSYLSQIFISLSRLYNIKIKERRKKDYNYNTTDHTFYDILKFIDREYINLKTVKQVSQKLSYNEDYISHLFKEKMGITIKEYLIRKKISEAMELLTTTNLKMEEIAEYLNFSSAHTFYQAFKRTTKIGPMEYKKRIADFRL